MKKGKINIPALTGMRAVAAGLVFFYHWFFTHASHLPLAVRGPFEIGYVGVPIFFALSGFLITLRYEAEVQTGLFDFWQYLYKRFVRIFPLYLFVLIFMVFAFGRPKNMMPDDLRQTVILLTMTQSIFPSARLIGTTVGWTLTIEFMYYIIAPLLMRQLNTLGRWRSIIGWTVFYSGLALFLGWLIALVPFAHWDTHLGEDIYQINHYSIFGHLPDFLVGMVAALLFMKRDELISVQSWSRPIIWLGLLGMYASMLVLAENPSDLGTPSNRFLAFLVALFAAVCFWGLSLDQNQQSFVTRILASRPLIFLGVTSYALYLVQLTEPIQWLYWVFLGNWLGIKNQVWRAISLLPLTIGISALLYYFVERPSHRLLSNLRRGQ